MHFCQGLSQDVVRRLPHYRSDFYDARNRKVLSSAFYLFFACLANAIAFGSLLGFLTGGEIGVIEMLIATAIGGIFYALFSAQPITLLGGTGPMVIFTSLVYVVCQRFELNFIAVYCWCGIWAGLILVLLAVVNTSNLMRYFSRFTDDIFAALVSIIFIYEAAKNIVETFHDQGANFTAWVGEFLAAGTCALALFLPTLKRIGPRPANWVKFLADFAPTIAIVAITFLTVTVSSVSLEGANVPLSFEDTTSGRPWLVELYAVPDWVKVAAIVPAFFAAVLLFLDQNITSHIINEGMAPLRKGHGYHLDLLLIGILTLVFSLFGLPWIVAATIHSVNHLNSLTVEADDTETPTLAVVENRVSALLIHLGIAASIFMLTWIKFIPMPVLFGLFIFMGIVSLRANSFFIRALSLAVPLVFRFGNPREKLASVGGRCRFTIVQLICFCTLWLVKSSVLGLLFPIFIALCVPVRLLMTRIIDEVDLDLLDDN